MKRVKVLGVSTFLLACLLLPVGVAQGQVGGEIQGRVVSDDNGEPLPGVTVTLTNTETGVSSSAFTNADGIYKAKALKTGTYVVAAALEGLQTVQAENVVLRLGQILDVNFNMGVQTVTEAITVTSDSPILEKGRAGAAAYVSDLEIEALPIIGRDFKEFAYLTPTVQNDTVRGFVTMSGQRGIYTGLNLDGVDNKSAFFGYGTGGEATENDGLVVAQDSVKEFQVVTSGFAPELGADGGGSINVITKSGTNDLKGSAFLFFRDDSLAEDQPASPLDITQGRPNATPVNEFERQNWGASIGGPIAKDRTHFFFSYDQTSRDEPFRDDFQTRGGYDAVLARAAIEPAFADLIAGYTPNNDGIAAADPVNGRTASGTFLRSVDNLILFGKVDHQFTPSQTFSFRTNFTDYERFSDFADEESEKLEDTISIVGQLVSVIGSNKVNEARVQFAEDNLDRLSTRVGDPIEAQIRFRDNTAGQDQIGKFDFLPIFVVEEKTQFQDNFSYLFGEHDLKFGIDYRKDDLSQLFKGSSDGRYDFQTLDDFINNNASNVRIFYGNVTNPNYEETQELLALYAQDTWRPSDRLTFSYGIRYGATYNPGDLEHLFPEGREIPDDTDNWQPRFGFTYTPSASGRDVVRGGIGLFTGRTPSLLFASQVQQNGIFPNFGRVNVTAGDPAFVPCCQDIDNTNPPAGSPNSPAYVDPSFEDAENLRLNLGYERQLRDHWSAGVDFVWSEGENLQSNIDLNRTFTLDAFGRPVYSGTRPRAEFNEIFTRQSIGESEYQALTFKVHRRFSGRYQFQAHYTWSQDEDTDSNERTATDVTVSVPNDPNYDWGLSDRDVKNRLVVSGLVELPLGFRVSGIAEYRSGRPYNPTDSGFDFAACAGFALGFNCPDARPVVNGEVVARNAYRNESVERLDVRVSKLFNFTDNYQFELFVEVFNVFDDNFFAVDGSFSGDSERDPNTATFGLADTLITTPRQIQLGGRFRF